MAVQNPTRANSLIMEALGLEPGLHVRSIELRFAWDEIPLVRIERFLLKSDSIETVFEDYKLMPRDEEAAE